jgi:hypothetical protein
LCMLFLPSRQGPGLRKRAVSDIVAVWLGARLVSARAPLRDSRRKPLPARAVGRAVPSDIKEQP